MSAHLNEAELMATCQDNARLRKIIASINGGAPIPEMSVWDRLEAWLNTDTERRVDQVQRLNGVWSVRIRGRVRYYSCSTEQSLENAIRTALGIAVTNGER